jgi:hypothetical protein
MRAEKNTPHPNLLPSRGEGVKTIIVFLTAGFQRVGKVFGRDFYTLHVGLRVFSGLPVSQFFLEHLTKMRGVFYHPHPYPLPVQGEGALLFSFSP